MPPAAAKPGAGDRRRHRLIGTLLVSVTFVATALAIFPSDEERTTLSLAQLNEVSKGERGLPHVDPPGTPNHTHDAKGKNLIARGAEKNKATVDPTTATERRASASYVASQRLLADPELTTVPVVQPRTPVARDRFAMAGGCYAMRTLSKKYIVATGDTFVLRKGATRATGFTFEATELGRHLVYTPTRAFASGSAGRVVAATDPSPKGEWWTFQHGQRKKQTFKFRLNNKRFMQARQGRLMTGPKPTGFVLERSSGCTAYPEAEIDIAGRPHAGLSGLQEVRGYVDGHTHGMAYEFLGGRVHCGRPWHRYGVEYALVDCPDHTATGGASVLDTVLSNTPTHDPVGWPTFVDWPAPDSLTHEGTYYRWLERAWRGGQRLFVNLFVENNQLCQVYPLKKNSCDDMDSVRLQAKRIRQLENYIDAQFGGPGKGFFRIVESPWEARKIINDGKMAVVLGIETSRPFGCTFRAGPTGDVPACDAADIERQLDEVYDLGVRQMELTNKFDNALVGVAGDAGATGVVINGANFLETGTFWDMQHCEPADGESADKTQLAFPDIGGDQQDALFGAIAQIYGALGTSLPLYPPPAHCNARGLTDLGEFTIREMADRSMIFDPDHMSVKGRQRSLDLIEELEYPGVISSHSWSTPDAYPRVYEAGGFITPYAGDSTGFVNKWRRHVGWADERFYFGIGFGADINGLGAQGDPRGADVANPVSYPFTGINGISVAKQRAGERVYDINVDGVAQYGLYPDWVEDLRQVAGEDGDAIVEDMARGAEAYLQMWERAEGIAPDSCRNPELRQSVSAIKRQIKKNMTFIEVMERVGQPFSRLGLEYGICANGATGQQPNVTITFTKFGRVTGVRG